MLERGYFAKPKAKVVQTTGKKPKTRFPLTREQQLESKISHFR